MRPAVARAYGETLAPQALAAHSNKHMDKIRVMVIARFLEAWTATVPTRFTAK
jgi:hypothetical protein